MLGNVLTLGGTNRLFAALKFNPVEQGPLVDHPKDPALAKSRPLVLLLGWAGSTRTQLKRYIDLYLDEGYTVISAMAPLEAYVKAVPPELCREVLRVLGTEHPPGCNRGIHVHLLSNNGFLLLRGLQVADPHFLSSVQSVVIDSAPSSNINHPNIGLALMFKAAVPSYAASLMLWLAYLIFWLRRQYASERRQSCSIDDIPKIPSLTLPTNRPVLFVYGTKDRMIPAQEVQLCINAHTARSTSYVQSREFSSGHCAHLKAHPKEYREVVVSFLDKCHPRSKL
jgi:pimeloyl-ACP methyl ester carboxylesterase